MRVGMIFECGRNGADGKVYPYLAHQLRSDLEIQPFFLDSKPRLIQECGVATKQLLEIDKCEGVLIIWDLRPPWPVKEQSERLCPVEDCERIRLALENKLTTQQSQKVYLLCIIQELETLLLVDEQALSQYLNRLTGRSYKVKRIPHPERRTNPKDVLYRIFESNGCKKYIDWKDAENIIRLANINRLQRCPTFQKFEKRIRGL